MDTNDITSALLHLVSALHLDKPTMLVPLSLTAAGAALLGCAFIRRVRRQRMDWRASQQPQDRIDPAELDAIEGQDTLIVMPDISGYTRFLASVPAPESANAKTVIVKLLDAIIRGNDKRLRIAKLEGDAVLFFVRADELSGDAASEVLVDIFAAFDAAKSALATEFRSSGIGNLIELLDLKIAVHRGHCDQFRFRNATDLIGANVVLVYRLLKNSLNSKRYVMATQAGAEFLKLSFPVRSLRQAIADFGVMDLTIFDIPENLGRSAAREPLGSKSSESAIHYPHRPLVA